MRQSRSLKDSYIAATFGSGLNEFQTQILSDAEQMNLLHMQVSAPEGRILEFLARSSQAHKVVEIGVLLGFSTSFFLEALSPGSKVFGFDQNEERMQVTQDIFAGHPKKAMLDWRVGTALEKLPEIESEGPFDLVFIDADKGNYLAYLDWAELHLKKGGLVVGDNTFLFGHVYGEGHGDWSASQIEKMKLFNSRLSDRSRYAGILLPTEEGLTVAQKLF